MVRNWEKVITNYELKLLNAKWLALTYGGRKKFSLYVSLGIAGWAFFCHYFVFYYRSHEP